MYTFFKEFSFFIVVILLTSVRKTTQIRMIKNFLFCIFFLNFLLSPVTGLAFSDAYALIKPDSVDIDPISTLLIYSVPNSHDPQKEISTFIDILESHWNVSIEAVRYSDISYSKALTYSHIILLEQNADTDAISLFNKIVENTKNKTYWIGFNQDTLTRNKVTIIDSIQIKNVLYKNVSFEVDEYFRITGTAPQKDLLTLASYTDVRDITHPYITMRDDKNLSALTVLPSVYKIDSHSLPFLDTFHYFFGHHFSNVSKSSALLRLEDVNVYTYYSGRKLNQITKYLTQSDTPFQIAFIPRYVNPAENIDMTAEESPRFISAIQKMLENGGILVQHGYTHQVNDEVTAIGYEFWDAQNNRPLQFSSIKAATLYPLSKINAAQEAMSLANLPVPDIWETPHYTESRIDNEVFNHRYPLRYEHIPGVGSLPFAASIDGTIYIPENLGYITDSEQPKDKATLLKQLSTFEDPVASVFWHPWRSKSELIELVNLIKEHGYSFVSAYDLVVSTGVEKETILVNPMSFGVILKDIVLYFVFFSFIVGAVIYAHNVFLVRKYLKQILTFMITLEEVQLYARENNLSLPCLALFVPARNEGLVIGNTLRQIDKIDYPRNKLKVYVIVDERELEDNVERTTKDVARETAHFLHAKHGYDFINIVEVPKWYSGVFGDTNDTFGKSTKGRALNYCLQSVDTRFIDMIGILDADGRLHPDVLKEVALKRMRDGAKLLQGPVFQVGNFKDVSIVGRAAGLELALHHLTELPSKLNLANRMQFLAGTNYFIDTNCIVNAGGWDQTALVEDAEIALRLYTKSGIVGEWLNSPEIEQTPPNFAVYRKQRHRWVRGHIDLIAQIHDSDLRRGEKFRLYNKIIFSQLRFLFDVGLPILSIYLIISGAYSYIHPIFGYISIILFFASACIWDTYGFMYRSLKLYIDPEMTMQKQIYRSGAHLLFLPIFIIIQAIPRFTALFSYIFNKQQNTWYKTERTVEAIIN